MAKGLRIKPTKVKKEKIEGITPTPLRSNDLKVIFSFDKLKEDVDFSYCNCEVNYFLKLLERLKDVSGMTRKEMWENKRTLRYHPIDFLRDDVSRKTFGYGEELDEDAYQFSISSNEHGRVHGYFIDNKFYIVWFDPEHFLYKGVPK